jgi:hypothetical protein
MPACRPLRQMLGLNIGKLTVREYELLEAWLFQRLYEEWKIHFFSQHYEWFRLLKITSEEEKQMIKTGFVCQIIKDILHSQAYDLEGIARYAQCDKEVIEDIIVGRNPCPSCYLVHRLLDLHQTTQPEMYDSLRCKILAELTQASEK